jgi:hypothetical protein
MPDIIIERCANCTSPLPNLDQAHRGYWIDAYLMDRRGWFCQTCHDAGALFECYECENVFRTAETAAHRSRYGNSYCDTCAQESLTWCDVHDEYDCDCENSDFSIERYGYILPYSTKPDPIFHGDTQLQFGIELEVEATRGDRQDMARSVWYLGEENVYVKSDGSLHHGFEIVSHPRDLDSWREWTRFGEKLYELRTQGAKAWRADTCGLHIHVARDGFDSLAHQARFALLFARNANQWKKVAGRDAAYASFRGFAYNGVVNKVKFPNMAGHSDAVNLGNRHTIEVRIWRPSLAFGRVLAALEFCHSAVEYTRAIRYGARDEQLTWKSYADWVIAHEYPHAKKVLAGGRFSPRDNIERSA